MSEDPRKIPAVSFTWAEGHYFDLWMIVHFLSGLIIGVIFDLLYFERTLAYVIALVLLILGEVIEYVFHVKESALNRGLDIVVGFIGFIFAYEILLSSTRESQWCAFVILAILSGIGNYLGWRAYHKRKTSSEVAPV